MRRLLRLLFSGAVPAPWDIYYFILGALPVLTGIGAAVAGYMQGIPWMWVIVGGTFSFAATGHALVTWSTWQQRNRVRGKIELRRLRGDRAMDDDNKFVLGVELANTADFPITVEIVRLSTRIADRVPAGSANLPQRVTALARGGAYFDDHPIVIGSPSHTVEGRIEYEIRYGRGDKLKYHLADAKTVVLAFDELGTYLGGNWGDTRL